MTWIGTSQFMMTIGCQCCCQMCERWLMQERISRMDSWPYRKSTRLSKADTFAPFTWSTDRAESHTLRFLYRLTVCLVSIGWLSVGWSYLNSAFCFIDNRFMMYEKQHKV